MTVVITGAGGFVGRVLVESLSVQGRELVALDTRLDGVARRPGISLIEGDIADAKVVEKAFAGGCDALIHLATVPGGAAEADPASSRRINLDAMLDLLARAAASKRPRVVYASSIAVLGDPLPATGVDDFTPISPRMIYGGHKAMGEIAVATMSNRREINGVTVRLPGILARPPGPSGMKSAFMSNVFHALRTQTPFTCPVSKGATIWAQSVERCADNLSHALSLDLALLPPSRAVTLPALRFSMGELVLEIAQQVGASPELITWSPDEALEQAFGKQPPLVTPAAEHAGFSHDGTLAKLVARALARIAKEGP